MSSSAGSLDVLLVSKMIRRPFQEFMLCRTEHNDPRKCLAEGKALTACGMKFLQQMKKFCYQEASSRVDSDRSGGSEPIERDIDFQFERAHPVESMEAKDTNIYYIY